MRVVSVAKIFSGAAALLGAVHAATFPYIPPGNQLYLGAWPDSEVSEIVDRSNHDKKHNTKTSWLLLH
jgi:hypothetical protein